MRIHGLIRVHGCVGSFQRSLSNTFSLCLGAALAMTSVAICRAEPLSRNDLRGATRPLPRTAPVSPRNDAANRLAVADEGDALDPQHPDVTAPRESAWIDWTKLPFENTEARREYHALMGKVLVSNVANDRKAAAKVDRSYKSATRLCKQDP